ncbi:MAG: DUF4924 family protein, partial [Prevotella sp.]|nr:DUF4924 family protein [Prevotella sp.]
MFISQQLRKKNIAEYLLYMWQVEDIVRAHSLDIERLKESYLKQFQAEGEQAKSLEEWYKNL